MPTTMLTTYAMLADALADELATGYYSGVIDDDAGDWFGNDDLLGFHLFMELETGNTRGECNLGWVAGDVKITDPNGVVHRYTIATTYGHVEVAKA